MQFDEHFFDVETVNGFTIESMVKRAWAAQLELYAMFKEYCDKRGLQFFADWGTLLGAVRHKGFIPWDDDIDLCMKRDDFLRLQKYLRDDPVEGMEYMSSYSEEVGFRHSIVRVLNSRQIGFDEERLTKYHGFPFACGLDVFPLDYMPRDEEERKFWITFYSGAFLLEDYAKLYETGDLEEDRYDEFKEYAKMISDTAGIPFSSEFPTAQEVSILEERIAAMYNSEDADYLTEIEFSKGYAVPLMLPKEAYNDVVMLDFENVKMPVPKDYDTVLKELYGEDYMTPRIWAGTIGHDYPFYKKQLYSILNHMDLKDEDEALALAYLIAAKYK